MLKRTRERIEALASQDGPPVEPMPPHILQAVRAFRWGLYACLGAVLCWQTWKHLEWWGFAVALAVALLLLNETRRADGTENYLFRHYEPPPR